MPRVLSVLALLSLSCAARDLREPPTRRIVQLLSAATAREGTLVLTSDETALLRLDGTRARLYGDAEGTRGWSVQGAVLVEVVTARGVRARVAVGQAGVLPEEVPRAGLIAGEYGPGEIDLTPLLREAEEAPFRVRTTAHGAAVSDLFLVLEPPPEPAPSRDFDRAPSF